MDIEYKKSGQIPAFGDWDNANELPITQYFECARQAGLVRYSSSSGEYDPYVLSNNWGGYGGGYDLYGVGYRKPPHRSVPAPPRKTSVGKNKRPDMKERRRQVKIRDVMDEPQPKSQHQSLSQKQQLPRHTNNDTTRRVAQRPTTTATAAATTTTVKPIDEDLYKIPPELLHKSERKKMLGFLSRCLAPPCRA